MEYVPLVRCYHTWRSHYSDTAAPCLNLLLPVHAWCRGQLLPAGASSPVVGPSQAVDFELEMVSALVSQISSNSGAGVPRDAGTAHQVVSGAAVQLCVCLMQCGVPLQLSQTCRAV
jgi:hypothetical protein